MFGGMADFSHPEKEDRTARHAPPISVAVLVDLEFAEGASGHVKCWQRFAEAAVEDAHDIDLTVYFIGEEERCVPLSETVRYRLLKPRLGTRRFPFLAQGAGHTDLAWFHPQLAQRLPRHDVLHTTDVFAFAATARRVSRRRRMPMVTSIHTDLPKLTEIYTGEVVRRLFGGGKIASLLLDDLELGAVNARKMARRVHRMVRRSDHVMVPHRDDWRRLAPVVGPNRLSLLRRGIDIDRFHPSRRDRARLADRFGIEADCGALLFVGRIDESKKAAYAARAAQALIGRESRFKFLFVGDGAQRQAIADILGPKAVLPGSVPQEDLAWIYPSADMFVFPSESETVGNVVLEAKASGLPALVADAPGPAQLVLKHGVDGLITPTADPADWTAAIAALLEDGGRRQEMGRQARIAVETAWPSWGDVLRVDLLPIWRDVALRRAPLTNSPDRTHAGFRPPSPCSKFV